MAKGKAPTGNFSNQKITSEKQDDFNFILIVKGDR